MDDIDDKRAVDRIHQLVALPLCTRCGHETDHNDSTWPGASYIYEKSYFSAAVQNEHFWIALHVGRLNLRTRALNEARKSLAFSVKPEIQRLWILELTSKINRLVEQKLPGTSEYHAALRRSVGWMIADVTLRERFRPFISVDTFELHVELVLEQGRCIAGWEGMYPEGHIYLH